MPRFIDTIEYENNYDGSSLVIGIVMSRFNQDICETLLKSCVDELQLLGVAPEDIEIATTPGALEIPLTLQVMAATERFDALIALGTVIRGETYHFELVANEMAAGITRIALDNNLPVANGVLTTEDDEQAIVRAQEKGADCARAAVEMARLLEAIDS